MELRVIGEEPSDQGSATGLGLRDTPGVEEVVAPNVPVQVEVGMEEFLESEAPLVAEVPDPLAAVVAGWLCYHEATGPLPTQMHFGQYLRGKVSDLVQQIRDFLDE